MSSAVADVQQPYSDRCPIRFRSPSNQIPSAVQSDSVRRPIRFRSLSDDFRRTFSRQTLAFACAML